MHYFDHDSALTEGRLLCQVDSGGAPIANIRDQPVVADHGALYQAATSGTPQRIVIINMMSNTAVCHVSAPNKRCVRATENHGNNWFLLGRRAIRGILAVELERAQESDDRWISARGRPWRSPSLSIPLFVA